MWQELAIALCLVCVLEGIIPFLSPRGWRQMVASMAQLEDRQIRIAGLCFMLFGTALLYLIRG